MNLSSKCYFGFIILLIKNCVETRDEPRFFFLGGGPFFLERSSVPYF